MIQTLGRHKLILIGVAVLIAVGVWYGSLSSSPPSPGLVTTPIAGASGPAEQGIVATLLTLRAVKLDGTIFGDRAFMSLKDFSTEIIPEPIGRENPFAPLSLQAAPSASTTKNAQIFTPRR
ncbi:MAG: hypothetical protein AAB804_02865 [Patescibacteria group bacterium]